MSTMITSVEDRRRIAELDRHALEALQLEKLNRLLAEILPHNAFYRRKLAGCPAQLENIDQLASLPLTTKEELQPSPGGEPFAANRTFPIEHSQVARSRALPPTRRQLARPERIRRRTR